MMELKILRPYILQQTTAIAETTTTEDKLSKTTVLEEIELGLSTGLEETIVVCCILQIDNGFTHS